MTTRLYDSLSSWGLCDDIHLTNINVGPRGDLPEGQAGIVGDRWQHQRVGYAEAPFATIINDVGEYTLEPTYGDSAVFTSILYVSITDHFSAEQTILVEDKNSRETAKIDSVSEGKSITILGTLVNSYLKNDNMTVSTLPEIRTEKKDTITDSLEGDWVEITDGEKTGWYEVFEIDSSNDDYDTIKVYLLDNSFRKDDIVSFISTSEWSRDTKNPIFKLQKNNWWDYAGQNLKAPEVFLNVDTQKDDDGNIISTKNGAWITADRENNDSQISLLLSKGVDDIHNWTDFLGDGNPGRLNPIIRHSDNKDRFAVTSYPTADDLYDVWQSFDGLTLEIDDPSLTSRLKIDYTISGGTVVGLMPIPINGETLTNGDNVFTFEYKGLNTNAQGDLTVTLHAADGTSLSHVFQGILRDTDPPENFQQASFSFALNEDGTPFEGRKYIRSVEFEIGNILGGGVFWIDDILPFVPPREDEIIEDPSVVSGEIGVYACYYTARKRPRQIVTFDSALSGLGSGRLYMGDTSDFDVGDIGVVYDRTNYEMFKVRVIAPGTYLDIDHIGLDGDATSKFQYDYTVANQTMVANNTYRVNKIYGSYIWTQDDISQWKKYPTDEIPEVILDVGSGGDWDEVSVRQPCVQRIGSKTHMSYVGTDASGVSKIGFAQSLNLVDFTKSVYNPLLSPTALKFDADGCFHPDYEIINDKCLMHYTGLQDSVENIGSALFESNFHGAYPLFHVSILVFPIGYKSSEEDENYAGFPKVKAVLYDQGNLRVEVKEDNTLQAFAWIDGKESSTDPDDDTSMANAFRTTLIHNHWNLVICQYNNGELSVHNVNMTPKIDSEEYFSKSPWRLTEDLSAGDSTITISGLCPTMIDAPSDFGGVGQDYMLYGYSLEGGSKSDILRTQVGRITSVTPNGDAFDCTLDFPIGMWGFSQENFEDSTQQNGILLAQGHDFDSDWNAQEQEIWRGLRAYESKFDSDDNHILFASNVHSSDIITGSKGRQEEGYWYHSSTGRKSYTGIGDSKDWTVDSDGNVIGIWGWRWIPPKFVSNPLLDPNYAKTPIVANDQDFNNAWHSGYVGHVECATDFLDYSETQATTTGGRTNLYTNMINSNNPPKPQWHLFDLSLVGAEPIRGSDVARWILTDWEGTKYPDDSGNGNDLYPVGSAGTCDEGYLGRTAYMTKKQSDALETLFFTDNFAKINDGNAQFEKNEGDEDTDKWDNVGVSACNLFKFNNQYRLAYTGKGKVPYEDTGTIVGDLFETSLPSYVDNDVTFTGTFVKPVGCVIKLYMSWAKKSDWQEMWSSETLPHSGEFTWTDSFNRLDGQAVKGSGINDYKYFVRWKLEFRTNSTNTSTPICKSFEVVYTDPGAFPTTQFFAEQDKLDDYRVPVHRVVLWNSDTGVPEDITARIREGGVTNLTYKIPIEMEKLADIVASDVSITVDNSDFYFSEKVPGGIFSDSDNYLNFEIVIYAGFLTADAILEDVPGEFEAQTRLLVNKVRVSSESQVDAVIECRSLLRQALNTRVGESVDGEENPLTFDGNIKDIMETLFSNENVNDCVSGNSEGEPIGAGIDAENLFIEDFDRRFGNIEVKETTVGEVVQRLAQACDGIVYTNNQGDIYFKTWENLSRGSYDIIGSVNMKKAVYTGQDYDRIIKKANIIGPNTIQGVCESPDLTERKLGRDTSFTNQYVQKTEWANDLARKIVARSGINESDYRLNTVYLPSVQILQTVQITDPVSNIAPSDEDGAAGKYLVHNFVKNITAYKDKYDLASKLAIPDPTEEPAMTTRIRPITSVTKDATLTADNEELVCDTDHNDITVSLPTGIIGTHYRITNTGTSGNDVIVNPDERELLLGDNSSYNIKDGGALIITYESTEGWV